MTGANVTRGLILAVSCLVLGFVGGWSLANIGGKTIQLPEARLDVTVAKPNPVTGSVDPGGTTAAAIDPKTAQILVLNASGVAGQAGRTQSLLTGKGYTAVNVDNASPVTGNTIYYADTAKDAATAVGADLQITTLEPLVGSAIADAAGDAAVVVVLGK